ncbi:PKD domain-containing protein [Pseudozobellia thermophila]|uniref:PKD domain-containing protein n=1 Tax=Pseudozobellia thermophila TaxID=192903 RepID=A0A1M6HGW5_9FLAO|nr:PKD domain-containing protein [Pseudozobellia thermophila]SHJ21432.1 PKD domain-containing protein [Pseudozobellia thermophila]
MKKYPSILVCCFSLFLVILACTKEVGLITEVKFELMEEHTREGYVNQGLPTTFTIVPEEVLENYEYSITYEVLDGAGYFEDMEGNRLDGDKGHAVATDLTVPLLYMGSETGEHRIKITGADNFGLSDEIEVTYELSDVPAVWEASSEFSEIELEKPVELSLLFEANDAAEDIDYEAAYGFASGSGSLGPSEENGYAPKGEYGPIVPGTYPLVFTPSEIGPQQLVFTLRDSNGQEIEAGVDFNVVDFIEVISITLSSQDTIKMKLGDEIPPAFTFDPPNATDQEVTVVSSDPDVVFIDENNVCIAVGLGTAVVTVTSISNPDARDTVTVEVIPPDRVPVTGISVSQAAPGATGAQRQLVATVLPENATDPSVTWSSGDDTIATVDGNGILTGLSAGTVTITATSVSDPEISGSVLVEITEVSLQSANDIETFALNGQIETATIDTEAHTVSVTVPEGTPLNVAPVMLTVSEGATVAPGLLQVRDFNSPVQYTVTSGNGTEQVWTVTANVLALPVAGDANITSFALPGQNSSDIDTENHTITVNVTDGTNLNVAPQVLEISPGATVTPAIGQVQDFSGAVTYTVSPETGTPQIWTVNVTVSQSTGSDQNAITGFALPVQNSVAINDVNHTITVNVPNGTDLNVVPSQLDISTGANIEPGPASQQDFSQPVNYTVTAENGNPQVWTVNVVTETSSEKSIDSFVINGISGTINGTDISVTLPFGTDVTALSPEIDFFGQSVAPSPGTPTDFTNDVVYTVTAEDNSTLDYTVSVTIEANTNTEPVVDVTGITDITLPTNSVDLVGSATDEDGTIVNYAWTQDSGPAATITDPSSSATTATDLVAGNYVFRLTATDNDNDTGSNTVAFTVNEAENVAPVAVDDNFTVAESGSLNRLVLTNDIDDDDLTVHWVGGSSANVGQSIGGSDGGLFTITAGGNLTFDTNGEFDGLNDGDSQTTTVQYRATDGNANSNTATVSVTVTGVDDPNNNPTAVIESNTVSGTTPLSVNFKGDQSIDDDGSIVSYNWDFGENNRTSTLANPTYEYISPGEFTVTLTVTDDDGATDSETVTITVSEPVNEPPTAVISTSATSGTTPLSVDFTGPIY